MHIYFHCCVTFYFLIIWWLYSSFFSLCSCLLINPYPVTEISLLDLHSGTRVLNVALSGAFCMILQSPSVLEKLCDFNKFHQYALAFFTLTLFSTQLLKSPISLKSDFFWTIKLLSQHHTTLPHRVFPLSSSSLAHNSAELASLGKCFVILQEGFLNEIQVWFKSSSFPMFYFPFFVVSIMLAVSRQATLLKNM